MPELYSTEHEREAYRMGADAGVAAASWVLDTSSWVRDGDDATQRAVHVLAMLTDGDPEAYDYLPARPDLSGEWADAPTPRSLYHDIMDTVPGESAQPAELSARIEDEIADAWEAGVASTFETECERILRAALPDPEDTSEDPCTDHGFDVCPDCGNGGVKIDSTGYVDCARFLTCWADVVMDENGAPESIRSAAEPRPISTDETEGN